MPRFRQDLDEIKVYRPGKPVEELTRELGITDVVKLASNESPVPPFPEVSEVIARVAAGVNRYPETTSYHLRHAIAARHGIDPENVWVGPGGAAIIAAIALSLGGSDTSALYADPSFIAYDIATARAGARHIRVPLDAAGRHDVSAMLDAMTGDTTLVYLCNPNNPTGTHVDRDTVDRCVAGIPDHTVLLIDEAYHEYVTAPDHETAIPHALERDNVIVLRTFSKVFGLAGLRVGYVIGDAGTLRKLQVTQLPFAVSTVAQAAALESLLHTDRLAARIKDNALGREHLSTALADRGVTCFESQANFVAFRPRGDCLAVAEALMRQGVIVRPLGDVLRITVGTPAENERFVHAFDQASENEG